MTSYPLGDSRQRPRRRRLPLYAPDGYQYGVRFNDGSVMAPWNGATQQERAREELAECRKLFPNDRLDLVRRVRGGEWETV
jgi:hypothetical protein